MGGCALTTDGLTSILQSMGESALQTLNLKNNHLKERDAQYLAEMLAKNNTLRTLVLCENELKGPGTIYLSEALKENSSLEELDMSNNGIDAEGMREFASLLKTNSRLKKLSLARNFVAGHVVAKLAKSLKTNTHLVSLDLSKNLISNEGGKALLEALEGNCTLTSLLMGGNSGMANAIVDNIDAELENNAEIMRRIMRKVIAQPTLSGANEREELKQQEAPEDIMSSRREGPPTVERSPRLMLGTIHEGNPLSNGAEPEPEQ